MNDTLSKVLIFAAGAAIGSAVTWKLVKTKYEQIAQEEIDSVKEVFSKRTEEIKNDIDKPHVREMSVIPEKPDLKEFAASLIAKEGYDTLSDEEDEDAEYYDDEEDDIEVDAYIEEYEGDDEDDSSAPYVISPEEFDELTGYNTETLTYYADGVLTDCHDDIIEDVENTVGLDSLNHFGEYEDDSVHVRNDARQCDYEILKDYREYYREVHPELLED